MRKSVEKLLPADLEVLRKAFVQAMALSDNRGFGYFAGWHGQPFNWCQHHTSPADVRRRGPEHPHRGRDAIDGRCPEST
jgi:hypothetical protein